MGNISGAEAIGFEPLGPNEPGAAKGGPLPGIPPKIKLPPNFAVPEKPDYSDYIIIEFGPPSVFDEGFDLIDLYFWPGILPSDPLPFPDPEVLKELEKPRIEPPEGYYPDDSRSMQMDKVIWSVPELHVPGQSSGDVFLF